jgi:serine protease Do
MSRVVSCVAALLMLAPTLCVSQPALAAAEEAPQSRLPATQADIKLSYAPLVRQVTPAVVNIYTKKVIRERVMPFNDPLFRQFFGNQMFPERERVAGSLGSGMLVSADGLVVTSNHVIEGADAIRVVLSDRREFGADVLSRDPRSDLAVLKLRTEGAERFPFLPLGRSEDLQVGDLVLAIGNPFGVGQTVTGGIVSGLARTSVAASDYRFFIQTDAAINPGNSGGALVDMAGRLVGVPSAIFSQTGGSIGIGFAVPSAMVRVVLEAAETGKPAVRPWLGASGQPVTQEIAQSVGLSRPQGVILSRVHPNSPLAQAGLREGDVLLTFNATDITDPEALRFLIATQTVGAQVPVTYWRQGQQQRATLRLLPPPEQPAREQTRIDGATPLAGAVIANINPALAEEVPVPLEAAGVVIIAIEQQGVAARLGLKPGDQLKTINGVAVDSVAAVRKALRQARPGGWEIGILRGGQAVRLVVN